MNFGKEPKKVSHMIFSYYDSPFFIYFIIGKRICQRAETDIVAFGVWIILQVFQSPKLLLWIRFYLLLFQPIAFPSHPMMLVSLFIFLYFFHQNQKDFQELMREVQEARRIKMLHQPSRVSFPCPCI